MLTPHLNTGALPCYFESHLDFLASPPERPECTWVMSLMHIHYHHRSRRNLLTKKEKCCVRIKIRTPQTCKESLKLKIFLFHNAIWYGDGTIMKAASWSTNHTVNARRRKSWRWLHRTLYWLSPSSSKTISDATIVYRIRRTDRAKTVSDMMELKSFGSYLASTSRYQTVRFQ